jgi:hypothetical protein
MYLIADFGKQQQEAVALLKTCTKIQLNFQICKMTANLYCVNYPKPDYKVTYAQNSFYRNTW